MRSATATRVVLGTACLTAPDRVRAAVGGHDPRADPVVRLLGARLALQAGADAVLGPRMREIDAAIELTHAASMLPVALGWPAHRRLALVSATVACGIAALDLTGRGWRRPSHHVGRPATA